MMRSDVPPSCKLEIPNTAPIIIGRIAIIPRNIAPTRFNLFATPEINHL